MGSAASSADVSLDAVVIAPDAPEAVAEAADEVRQLVERRTGEAPKIFRSNWRYPDRALYLGDSLAARWSLRIPGDLHRQGYIFHARDDRYFVRGKTAEGVVNGAIDFLRRFVGARRFWPGELGFEWVEADEITGHRWRREEPAFSHRWLGGFRSEPERFVRWSRLNRDYTFNHNFGSIFDRKAFEARPEAFAEIRGERRAPSGSNRYDPQPDFTSDAAVEIAADAAREHFRANPEAVSFSISTNDNVRFDTSEATREVVEPLSYFRGLPNYTDLVFGFANRVAERVFADEAMRSTPDGQPRFLTSLAYFWAEAAPTVELHPRVLPVLTADRAQWADPDFRAQDRALIEAWANSGAAKLASWDYYFGAAYPYPRQFNEWIGRSVNHQARHGVDVFFAQLSPVWGFDGAKPWIAARLLWDATADVEALERRFHRSFFGPAGDPMARFYETLEDRRDRRLGDAAWIKFYKDEAGIEMLSPEDCAELNAILERAQATVAPGSRFAERIGVVRDAFAYTTAYSEMHHARNALSEWVLQAAESEDAAFAEGWRRLERFSERRAAYRELKGSKGRHRLNRRLATFDAVGQSDPAPAAAMALYRIGDDSERERLIDWMAARDAYAPRRVAVEYFHDPGAPSSERAPNPGLKHAPGGMAPRDFLGPPVPDVPGWAIDFRPSEHLRVARAEEGGDGPTGVRYSGADAFSLFTDVDLEGGENLVFKATLAFRASPDNRSSLQVHWRDAEGDPAGRGVYFRLPTGASQGERTLRFALKAPEDAARARIRCVSWRQRPDDFVSVRSLSLEEVF